MVGNRYTEKWKSAAEGWEQCPTTCSQSTIHYEHQAQVETVSCKIFSCSKMFFSFSGIDETGLKTYK